MKRHLNTLFVTTDGSYLAKEGQAVAVKVEGEKRMHIPFHNLSSIVCFGRVSCSPALMGACGENGISLSFLTSRGRFLARVQGRTSGNVLLRREQYRAADAPQRCAALARTFVVGKIANARLVLQRALRDGIEGSERSKVSAAVERLRLSLGTLRRPRDVDAIRGIEGEASRAYFGVFDLLVRHNRSAFHFGSRTRRPPLNPTNALLSFIYTLLRQDVEAALETVGLDPQVGFLHCDRPGRPSLALDLMEELRPLVADRLGLRLINLRQIDGTGFITQEAGAVTMRDATRKTVLKAYQSKKALATMHPFTREKMTLGMVPLIQARLLARHIRGDLDDYPPFLGK